MAKDWRESDMILVVNTLRTNSHLKVTKVAQIHNVPPKTLKARLLRQPSQQDCIANSRKLTSLEEEVIIQHILDLDSCLFLLQISNIEDIANQLLQAQNQEHVSKNWTSNFVQQQPQLQLQFNQRIDYQQALYKDLDIYNI